MDHLTFAQLLGNYGEFVGAIGVVVTLGYLAVQIRQNTRSNCASAELETLTLLINWVRRISSDKDAHKQWWRNREVPFSAEFTSYVDRVMTRQSDWRPQITARQA